MIAVIVVCVVAVALDWYLTERALDRVSGRTRENVEARIDRERRGR